MVKSKRSFVHDPQLREGGYNNKLHTFRPTPKPHRLSQLRDALKETGKIIKFVEIFLLVIDLCHSNYYNYFVLRGYLAGFESSKASVVVACLWFAVPPAL